jgi:hypothetical protein
MDKPMKIQFKSAILSVFIIGDILVSCTTPEPPYTRNFLKKLVDNYLEAVVAGDPSALPLSPSLKFTENTAEIKIGEGLWVGASEAPTTFKVYVIDTISSQIGFYGVMKEFDFPIILALRLKVENSQITEIEHVIARRIGVNNMKNLITPRPGLLELVPVEQRVSREEMYEIANLYFEAIEQDDGSIAPFADDCARHENGIQTTTNVQPDTADFGDSKEEQFRLAMARIDACGCGKQIDTQNLSYISRIQPRRLIIIDEEVGLVFGFPMFVHLGDVQSIKIIGVQGVDTIPKNFPPFNLQAGEIFKITNGQIHEIEANGTILPYGASSGWEDD